MPEVLHAWKESDLQPISLRNYVYIQVDSRVQLRPQVLAEAFSTPSEVVIDKLGLRAVEAEDD